MAARYERFGSGVLLALLFAGFGMALSSEALFGPEATALVPAISSFFAMVVLWGGLSRHVKQVAVDRFL